MQTPSSCPDLIRASTKTPTAARVCVDGRDEPGHDEYVSHLFASEHKRDGLRETGERRRFLL
jgi:hypothetical protein